MACPGGSRRKAASEPSEVEQRTQADRTEGEQRAGFRRLEELRKPTCGDGGARARTDISSGDRDMRRAGVKKPPNRRGGGGSCRPRRTVWTRVQAMEQELARAVVCLFGLDRMVEDRAAGNRRTPRVAPRLRLARRHAEAPMGGGELGVVAGGCRAEPRDTTQRARWGHAAYGGRSQNERSPPAASNAASMTAEGRGFGSSGRRIPTTQ